MWKKFVSVVTAMTVTVSVCAEPLDPCMPYYPGGAIQNLAVTKDAQGNYNLSYDANLLFSCAEGNVEPSPCFICVREVISVLEEGSWGWTMVEGYQYSMPGECGQFNDFTFTNQIFFLSPGRWRVELYTAIPLNYEEGCVGPLWSDSRDESEWTYMVKEVQVP